MKKTYTLLTALLIHISAAFSAAFYVAVDGNDTNSGTKSSPFATIMRAQQAVEPGDTVFVRGGKYLMQESQLSGNQRIYAVMNLLNKSGKPGQMIHYMAYPGEVPVIDMTNVKPANRRVMVFNVTGSWIHIKGLEVVGTQVTITTHTQSECFHNEGSNNIYENLAMHDGQAIGFYLIRGSDNLILNSDAYRNWDYTSEGGRGGNADGFGCHPQPGSKGNVFRGCRAWFNSDDGYDCIRAAETVTFDHCWAFYNGFGVNFERLGDGNGFKAGGWGLVKDERVPDVIPMHVIQFCMAVGNRASGFYANHQPGGNYWYNNTAYNNSTNYNMLNRTADITTDVPGYGHVLKNNLSLSTKGHETMWIDTLKCEVKNNTFYSKMQVTPTDFKSLDESQLSRPRNADGSLPTIEFLHLKKTSKLIDKGLKLGFPFKGNAPDMGAFEEE